MMEGTMFPRDGEEGRTSMLTTLAGAVLLALLVATVIKYDLWQVPDDQSAAILLQGGSAPPVSTALKAN
jgi:hypothetical protein